MIKPLGNKIQLEIADEKIGAIQSESIQEKGVIIAKGEYVETYKTKTIKDEDGCFRNVGDGQTNKFPIGATLYFKAWAVDIITEDGKKYYFIDANSDAICAISQ